MPNIEREFAWTWLADQDGKRRTDDQRYAILTLWAAGVAAVTGVIAAVAGVWALFR
jgi:hypothetical protein